MVKLEKKSDRFACCDLGICFFRRDAVSDISEPVTAAASAAAIAVAAAAAA